MTVMTKMPMTLNATSQRWVVVVEMWKCGTIYFDWEELEDNGGHKYPHVQNPALPRFLTIHSTEKAVA
jgi:hypothetical protein